MTIWELLGFGVNHERIAKYEQKAIEQQNLRIQGLVRDINYHGINELLELKRYDIKDIKAVLKYFDEAPIKDAHWEKHWSEAKQWLYEQEHPELARLKVVEKEVKELKKKNQMLEQKMKDYDRNR